jgi:hypothetical protein
MRWVSRILICLAVIVGMVVPAAEAYAGQHPDGSRFAGQVGHDHPPSTGAAAFHADGDRIGDVARSTCDPATGHCVTGFMLPSLTALRLPALCAAVRGFPAACTWSDQMPDTATPPPRV